MAESKYAYLLTEDGLYRVNIPDFDLPHQPQFMLECVGTEFDDIDTPTMGIFSKGQQDVYLFGGLVYDYMKGSTPNYNRSLYFFNPCKVKEKEYPIKDTKLLYKSSLKYEPMVTPCVLQAKHKTYLFSVVHPSFSRRTKSPPGCCFQSFDPIKNCFCTLTTPPLDPPNDSLDHSYPWYSVRAYFLVYDHIYLFISVQAKLHAFSFDTRSSKWKEIESLLSEFEERDIPIPHSHIGNIGLSSKFNDNTQILVALDLGRPTAYRVRIGAAGSSLHPESYRRLLEYDGARWGNTSHLLDIGNQRFCVIFSRREKPLLVYAFKMDFAVEYENQGNSTSLAKPSIEILCSKKFLCSVCNSVCLAYAPVSQRCSPWEPESEPGVVYLEV